MAFDNMIISCSCYQFMGQLDALFCLHSETKDERAASICYVVILQQREKTNRRPNDASNLILNVFHVNSTYLSLTEITMCSSLKYNRPIREGQQIFLNNVRIYHMWLASIILFLLFYYMNSGYIWSLGSVLSYFVSSLLSLTLPPK